MCKYIYGYIQLYITYNMIYIYITINLTDISSGKKNITGSLYINHYQSPWITILVSSSFPLITIDVVFTHKENHYQSQIRKYSGFNGPKDRKPWALLQAHPGGSSMGWLYRGIGGYSNHENSWRLWCSIGMSSDSHGISWDFHGIFLGIRTRQDLQHI